MNQVTEEEAFKLWHGVPMTMATEEQISIHGLLFDDNVIETRDEIVRLREECACLKDESARLKDENDELHTALSVAETCLLNFKLALDELNTSFEMVIESFNASKPERVVNKK